jgi:hypothetical protein
MGEKLEILKDHAHAASYVTHSGLGAADFVPFKDNAAGIEDIEGIGASQQGGFA